LFLARVRDFSPSEIGTTMLVSGLAMFLSAPIAGRLVRLVDLRIPMAIGFAMCTWSMWIATNVTSDWGFWQFASVQAIRGMGVMTGMIAVQQATMSTLPPAMVKNASGIVNLSRNVGGAFGLALLNTSLTQRTAAHYDNLSAGLTAANPQAQAMMEGLAARMEAQGVADPMIAAAQTMSRLLQREATTLAFSDSFGLLGIGCAIAVIIALNARPARANAGASGGGGH
jgi:DHA2 family multidrug resistance protein